MARIAFMRSLMMNAPDGEPRFYVFNTCPNLIRELPRYHYGRGTDSRNPTDLPLGVHDHAIDSASYGIFSDHMTHATGVLPEPQKSGIRFNPRHGVVGHFPKRSLESVRSITPANGKRQNGAKPRS